MMSLNITYIMNNSFDDSTTEIKNIFKVCIQSNLSKINNFTRIFIKWKKYFISTEKNKDLINWKTCEVQ